MLSVQILKSSLFAHQFKQLLMMLYHINLFSFSYCLLKKIQIAFCGLEKRYRFFGKEIYISLKT